MKIPRILLSFCLLSSVLCLEAAPDRFDRTKARIDALLNPRLKPDALPAKPANPFLFTGTGALFAVASGGPTVPAKAPVAVTPDTPTNTVMTDDQILAFCVSRIRIGGQVMRGERTHLLINSATYKDGDLIPVRANAETVYYVKIVRIAPGEVVFGYNDVFVTLPLKS
jgi:hypothetical protein